MHRRTFLTTSSLTLATTFAGCTGNTSQPNEYTQAQDGNKIRKQISQLLLTRRQLDSDWSEVPRPRENETEFEKHEDGDLQVINSRVWIYGTITQGKEQYRTQTSKADGSTSTIDLAVEAIQYTVSTKVEILFRDANAVGRLKYEYLPESGSQSPDSEVALTYAKLLYENFH